jgi:RHS repeat-associated protein
VVGPVGSDGTIVKEACTDHMGPPEYYYGYQYFFNEIGQVSRAIRGLGDGTGVQEDYLYDSDGQRVLTTRTILNPNSSNPQSYTVEVFDSLVLKNTTATSQGYTDSASTEQVYLAGGLARAFYDSTNTLPEVGGKSNHLYMLYPDHRGSVGFVVDHDTGEVVERTTYMPYGQIESDFRPARWGANREDLKFTGNWDNNEVGLVYMNARYYSPSLGRFISPDPVTIHGVAGDPNPYEYANGNPSGLLSQDEGAALGAGLAVASIFGGAYLNTVGFSAEAAFSAANMASTVAQMGMNVSFNALTSLAQPDAPALHDLRDPNLLAEGFGEWLSHGNYPGSGFIQNDQVLSRLQDDALLGATAAATIATSGMVLEIVAALRVLTAVAATEGGVSAIGSTGRIGEAFLKTLGGESQAFFRTSQGGRFVDQLVNGTRRATGSSR